MENDVHAEVKEMKEIPIERRPNIGYGEMENYEFGGLCVEQCEANGVLVYIPYGVYVDIFNAIETGVREIGRSIDSLQKSIEEAQSFTDEKVKQSVTSVFENQINHLKKNQHILHQILPLSHEV